MLVVYIFFLGLCGGLLISLVGYFVFFNYFYYYLNNVYCEWIIFVLLGFVFKIDFFIFKIEEW